MGTHVLVPFDGSDAAERGLERAVEDHPDATVTVLSVVDPLSEAGRDLSEAPLEVEAGGEVAVDGGTRAGLAAVDRFARDRDVDVRTVVEVGTPASAVVEYADEHGVDEVVVGTRGRSGLYRLLFGSVAETIGRHASPPVTLVT